MLLSRTRTNEFLYLALWLTGQTLTTLQFLHFHPELALLWTVLLTQKYTDLISQISELLIYLINIFYSIPVMHPLKLCGTNIFKFTGAFSPQSRKHTDSAQIFILIYEVNFPASSKDMGNKNMLRGSKPTPYWNCIFPCLCLMLCQDQCCFNHKHLENISCIISI